MPELPNVESSLDALNAVKDVLAAIPPESCHPIRVTHARAWELSAALYTQAQALLPLVQSEYAPHRAELVLKAHAELLRYAHAFYAAEAQLDAAARSPQQPKTPALQALESELKQIQQFLLHWAKRFFEDHETEARTLKRLKAGTGKHDTATDILGLVAMFRRQWEALETDSWTVPLAKKGLTADYLELAARKASHWLEFKSQQPEIVAGRLLRMQAFTALNERYTLIMKAGRHLMPHLKWSALNNTRRK